MMRSLPGLLAVIGLGSTAQAGYIPTTWMDHVDGGMTLNRGDSMTYTHDISAGFNVGSDQVHDFLLSINLYDDEQEKWYDIEAALVDIPGWLGDAPVWKFGTDLLSRSIAETPPMRGFCDVAFPIAVRHDFPAPDAPDYGPLLGFSGRTCLATSDCPPSITVASSVPASS